MAPLNQTIAKGALQQFIATGTYSDSTTHDITSQLTWTSLSPGVATMSATTFGLASGVAAGTATIKAASGSIFGAATLTVVEPILVSIAVTPANAIVAKGLTRQFIATGSYTPALTQDITSQVTWSTTNSSIATMSTTTAGLASGVATGSTTITATDPSTSVQGSTTLSVMLLLGGSVQGNTLNLANTVSTFAGSAGVNGHTDGTGTAARFYLPTGIATDGRNLYVTDTSNHTIRKVEIATGAVTTLAGLAPFSGSTNGTGTTARFNSPYGITTDGTNLYVADTYNHIIRKVVIATGEVTTFAGMKGTSGSVDGTGTAAAFYYPYGITTDGTNLYVADTYNHTIR
ncbi:MAG: Ig-like domain-containing protein, partial [Nitrospirota bacterium]